MKRITHLKDKLAVTAIIVAFVLIMAMSNISCLIKKVTGIVCPGCGMTRAYISLLHFDFAKAFEYHKMFWSVPVIYVYFLFDGRIFKNKNIDEFVLISISLGFFVNWIISLCG